MKSRLLLCMSMFVLVAVASPGGAGATKTDSAFKGRPSVPVAGQNGLKNEGVGLYTDPSVASQVSTFTINPVMVSCGVGTPADSSTGSPSFAMLMHSLRISSYKVNGETGFIKARGTMRSITQTGGDTMEDVKHKFLAIAVDGGDSGADRFDVHFKTDLWNTSNPTCTPSDKVDGGCRFGGELFSGNVVALK